MDPHDSLSLSAQARASAVARRSSLKWTESLFNAKSARQGGVVRRAVRDVEREVGRAAFELEVRRRGFHLIEVAGQFVVICQPGRINLIC
jgi:hypothetical protein